MTGPNALQFDVAPDALVAERRAVLRGIVRYRDGLPVTAVRVAVLGQPELGYTQTRADGRFDLAVNGGGPTTVTFAKAGLLRAQRTVDAGWQEYVEVPEVVLIQLDERVTSVSPESAFEIEVAQGSVVSDAAGTRRATLFFQPGTRATMVVNGQSLPLSTLSVRATEYTVGETGEAAMPASLPASSAYTYCVELSVDEALAAGASRVEFSHPVSSYVENFLGFPVGAAVPQGTYDHERGEWIAEENGRVIEIVSIVGGLAQIDTDGVGGADSDATLALLGITPEERARLAELFAPGQTLWSARMSHFSTSDSNWPANVAAGDVPPPDPEPGRDAPPECGPVVCGSIIDVMDQTLGEAFPIVGTPFSLQYRSDRVPGRISRRVLRIPLTGTTIPGGLKEVRLNVSVAGRSFRTSHAPTPNQSTVFTWDGKDAYGRLVAGSSKVTVELSYVYTGRYASAFSLAASFGMFGNGVLAVPTRSDLSLTRVWKGTIGDWSPSSAALGGLTLNVHHGLDPLTGTIHSGGGSHRTHKDEIRTIAGTGVAGFLGDGGQAAAARLSGPKAVTSTPDGVIYLLDSGNGAIRRVGRDGIISSVNGQRNPVELLVNPSAEEPLVNGNLPGWTEVVGNWTIETGGPPPQDGATYFYAGQTPGTAELRQDVDVSAHSAAIDAGMRRYTFRGYVRAFSQNPPDASRIIIEYRSAAATVLQSFDSGEIRNTIAWQQVVDVRVAPAGTRTIRVRLLAHRYTGTNNNGYFDNLSLTGSAIDDGTVATLLLADAGGIAAAGDGSLYVTDTAQHRVLKLDPDGGVTIVAGTGSPGSTGDTGPASNAMLSSPQGVAIAPDGALFIADTGNHRICRVGPDGTIATVAGTGTVGSSGDGGAAAAARLSSPGALALAQDGTLYVADTGNHKIRTIGPDGTIRTVAGSGANGFSGDGGPAVNAGLSSPHGVAVGRDGSFYIADTANHRVRRVVPGGIIVTVAGSGATGDLGDLGAPVAAQLDAPIGVALNPAGQLLIADSARHRIRRVTAPTPFVANADNVVGGFAQGEFPIAVGDDVLIFDGQGRQLRTVNAVTGTTLVTFAYDGAGRLASATDKEERATTFDREADGSSLTITAPHGQVTRITLDANGHPDRVTNPAGDEVDLDVDPEGRLVAMRTPRGYPYAFHYDDVGQIIEDHDPAGGSQTLTRSGDLRSALVTQMTAMGRTSVYSIEQLPDGTERRTAVDPAGLQTIFLRRPDGVRLAFHPDGTVVDVVLGPDPRFGMEAPLATRRTITTPGSLVSLTSAVRSVTLADPADPLSLSIQVDTVTVGGQPYTTVYDAATRTVTEQSPLGRASVTTLDVKGRPVRTETPAELPVEIVYDGEGRPSKVTQGERQSELVYGADGFLAQVKDSLGATLFERDAAGRVTRTTMPDGGELGLVYDASGNIVAVTPPGQTEHSIGYTPLDFEASYLPPDLGDGAAPTQYEYNQDRQLGRVTRPDGRGIEIGYDGAGRLATMTSATESRQWSYGLGGKLDSIVGSTGNGIHITWDGPLPVRLDATGTVAGAVGFTYDTRFLVSAETVSGTNPIAYVRDADGLNHGRRRADAHSLGVQRTDRGHIARRHGRESPLRPVWRPRAHGGVVRRCGAVCGGHRGPRRAGADRGQDRNRRRRDDLLPLCL